MPVSKAYPVALVAISLLGAMSLRILLLPYPWSVLNPDWIALTLIIWALTTHGRVGVATAWGAGLLTDLLTGRLLGQHALAYSVMIYLAVRWGKSLRFQSIPQQILSILGLLLIGQLLVLWTQRVEPEGPARGLYWLASVGGALIWPLYLLFAQGLNRLHRTP